MPLPNVRHMVRLQYSITGDPRKVLELVNVNLSTELKSDQVLVGWLASPINPVDLNHIQGNYAFTPSLPATPGIEGVGRVEKIGNRVVSLQCGDHVIPSYGDIGCWRSFGVHSADSLMKIDKRIDIDRAATLFINPPTAYCMLKEFIDLEKGDVVIQNGANSAVGRDVIQLARAFGLKTINIIRNRPNVTDLIDELKSIGADYVLTEEEFRQTTIAKLTNDAASCRLALNGVGGRSALMIASALDYNGILVTYGGMSKRPVELSTGSLIFKQLQARGFAITPWLTDPSNADKKRTMFETLTQLIIDGRLRAPHTKHVPVSDYRSAIDRAISGVNEKQLLIFDAVEAKI